MPSFSQAQHDYGSTTALLYQLFTGGVNLDFFYSFHVGYTMYWLFAAVY
jgi:hypothetical protein